MQKRTFRTWMKHKFWNHLQWEVSRLSTVSHPNLVQFYGMYKPKKGESPYLVMEFCEGGTLQGVLERE